MFKEITAPIKNELDIFEKKLYELINNQNNFLKEYTLDFIFSNPKRLRVILIFLFAKILKIKCDTSKSDMVLKIALITELLHSASLIHDDIIDEDNLRRNIPSFYNKFGSKLAVLQGDLLLSNALKVLSKTNLDILNIFALRVEKTINGEIIQNENKDKIINEQEYYKKTFEKTGNLFIAGLEALFSLGEFESDLKNNLLKFLKNFATAFQIKNDIDNLKSNKSDIKNGNYTLSMLYFFMENNKISKNIDLEKYTKKAIKKLEEFKTLTISFLDKVPDSIYKESLLKLCLTTLRS